MAGEATQICYAISQDFNTVTIIKVNNGKRIREKLNKYLHRNEIE